MIVMKNILHYYENKKENYLKDKKNILYLLVKILTKLNIFMDGYEVDGEQHEEE